MANITKAEQRNIKTLHDEISWLERVIGTRIGVFVDKQKDKPAYKIPAAPDLSDNQSVYAQFVNHYKLQTLERLALTLTIAPYFSAHSLDAFFTRNSIYQRGFTEFGGVVAKNHTGFIPTGNTLAFLISDNAPFAAFMVQRLFDSEHVFSKHGILKLNPTDDFEPDIAGTLQLDNELIEIFSKGKATKPSFSHKFPATQVSTQLNWSDFIIDENVMIAINDISLWLKHSNKILNEWNLANVIKPGYRALFYGPPGTGKTFAASLIGKSMNKPVYKVDLSMVVSKWVGETEKNLARIFDTAEHKDWILFFDEADALFGKRTNTQSSQERYANQEVAYLLQRTEDYPGTIILASNLRGNMDEAFTRRFQSIIYFPIPKPKQRLQIWQNYFSKSLHLHQDIDLAQIAQDYEITGGGVVNVLKHCAIHAAANDNRTIDFETLREGIRKEQLKEGKLS